MPGRYKMIAEKPSRPAGDQLDFLIREATGEVGEDGKPTESQGIMNQVGNVIAGMRSFMRALK